ncbi:hypothetical protein [Hwangdonia lutea]|uniref:Secreted protein n=1 Tax=Hwangdonia lutea TaxID=3075823 RepID=A0AA97HRC5_9FLAO|nr:hypothetical protein [Hwangdonia sp. SCSIO 19198]WOD44462.1 hypothetical protein RNZ46_04210 [Hwangdonia sp. SCSIO 19198]
MKTKLFTTCIACFIIASAFSQTNLNDYKYVIVPKKYSFLKQENQYLLNSLTKFLFEKYGFNTLLEGENYPDDFKQNRCMGLNSDVLKESGMFKTKLTVALKDCNGVVVYTSQLGESRLKDYGKAYNEALRNAFKSFEAVNYSYKPSNKNAMVVAKTDVETNNEVAQEIQKLKEEIQSLKKEKEDVAAVSETKIEAEEIIEVPLTEAKSTPKTVIEGTSNILYAQETANGFQLVDSSPKVVYRINKTNLKDVFVVEGIDGIIYKKDNTWFLDHYYGATLTQEELNIKF